MRRSWVRFPLWARRFLARRLGRTGRGTKREAQRPGYGLDTSRTPPQHAKLEIAAPAAQPAPRGYRPHGRRRRARHRPSRQPSGDDRRHPQSTGTTRLPDPSTRTSRRPTNRGSTTRTSRASPTSAPQQATAHSAASSSAADESRRGQGSGEQAALPHDERIAGRRARVIDVRRSGRQPHPLPGPPSHLRDVLRPQHRRLSDRDLHRVGHPRRRPGRRRQPTPNRRRPRHTGVPCSRASRPSGQTPAET
jgi:hypothetical protein